MRVALEAIILSATYHFASSRIHLLPPMSPTCAALISVTISALVTRQCTFDKGAELACKENTVVDG